MLFPPFFPALFFKKSANFFNTPTFFHSLRCFIGCFLFRYAGPKA